MLTTDSPRPESNPIAGLLRRALFTFVTGLFAVTTVTPALAAKLSDAFKLVMTNPDIRNRMVAQGADLAFMGSDEFAQFLASETPRWAQAVKASGAKLD